MHCNQNDNQEESHKLVDAYIIGYHPGRPLAGEMSWHNLQEIGGRTTGSRPHKNGI